MIPNYSENDIRLARDRFEHLILTEAPEPCFQELFSECPYILSSALPFKLSPQDIIPLGRPGLTEPDFIYFGSKRFEYPIFGVIEIKRPDSPVLISPRKNIIVLSTDARTAIEQCEKFSIELRNNARERFDSAVFVGNEAYNFIIMGLTQKIASKLSSEWQAKDIARQLPGNCRILPYDTVFKQFASSIPPKIMILTPSKIFMAFSNHNDYDQIKPLNALPYLREFVETECGVTILISIDNNLSHLSINPDLQRYWRAISSFKNDGNVFYIQINPKYVKHMKHKELQFTIAHEIAHLYGNHYGKKEYAVRTKDDDNTISASQQWGWHQEAEADSFAAQLLEQGEESFIKNIKNQRFKKLFRENNIIPNN